MATSSEPAGAGPAGPAFIDRALVRWARGPNHPLKLRLQGYVWRALAPRHLDVPYLNGTRLTIDPNSHIGRHVLYDGAYEKPVYDAIVSRLGPDGVFVDIGCHVGCFSIPVARRCARVVAVDALPDMVQTIREAARRNGLRNVQVCHAAITDSVGHAELYLPADRQMSSLSPVWPGPSQSTIRVRTLTLAALLDEADLQRVNVLKIDAEGESLRILTGAADALDRVDAVIFESDDNGSAESGAELLGRHGFEVRTIEGCDVVNFVAQRS